MNITSLKKASDDTYSAALAQSSLRADLSCVLVVGPSKSQGGVATFVDMLLSSDRLKAHYKLIHLDTTRAPYDIAKVGRFSRLNARYVVSQVIKLISIVIRYRPKIMHLQVTSYWSFWKVNTFMFIGQMFRIKVVMHLHGGMFDQYYRQSSPFTRSFIGWIFSRADIVIALSSWWKFFLTKEVRPDICVEIVPNVVDTMFAQAVGEPLYDASTSSKNVLFVGSIGQRKGIFDIIKSVPLVLAEQTEAFFFFAGEEEKSGERLQVNQACLEANLGDAMNFLGQVTGSAKLNLFKKATIFVLPSYGENLPYSLLEAMAIGLPVITTPVGAIPEVITHGINGFLIQPGDYVALAGYIVKLLSDPELRIAMGQANQERIRQDFMPIVAMKQFDTLYKQLLEGNNK